MDGLDTALELLNYGGFAVLSLAFLLVLWMSWRRAEADSRSHAALLEAHEKIMEKADNGRALLGVVEKNTQAMTRLCDAVTRNAAVVEKLHDRMR